MPRPRKRSSGPSGWHCAWPSWPRSMSSRTSSPVRTACSNAPKSCGRSNGGCPKWPSASGSAATQNEIERIHTKTSAITAQLRRFQTYAELQLAYGKLLTTIGVDVIPEAVAGDSLPDIAVVIEQRLATFGGNSRRDGRDRSPARRAVEAPGGKPSGNGRADGRSRDGNGGNARTGRRFPDCIDRIGHTILRDPGGDHRSQEDSCAHASGAEPRNGLRQRRRQCARRAVPLGGGRGRPASLPTGAAGKHDPGIGFPAGGPFERTFGVGSRGSCWPVPERNADRPSGPPFPD